MLNSWKIRAVIAGYTILLGLFFLLFPLFLLFNASTPYRPVVMAFLDQTCGGRPSNTEPRGIYPNGREASAWRIAIYNGQCKHRLYWGLGGDDFRDAASSPEFTHRINASNVNQASEYLSELLHQKPASVTDVEIAILDHGQPGAPRFAFQTIPESFYAQVDQDLPNRVTLRFYGCAVAKGSSGQKFMNRLADRYGFRVIASREKVAWNTLRWVRSDIVRVPQEDWITVEPQT